MTDLKELIERELEQYLEWPATDKSHVTTASAKLFAEHVAQLYEDHIRDAGKMAAPAVQGEPVGAEQQPDVAQLVDALEACRDELLWMIERHNQQDQNDGSWLYDHQTVVEADAALAAHRKGGE